MDSAFTITLRIMIFILLYYLVSQGLSYLPAHLLDLIWLLDLFVT